MIVILPGLPRVMAPVEATEPASRRIKVGVSLVQPRVPEDLIDGQTLFRQVAEHLGEQIVEVGEFFVREPRWWRRTCVDLCVGLAPFGDEEVSPLLQRHRVPGVSVPNLLES